LFELEERTSRICLDILNFHAECLRLEIDDDVLHFTRTNNVGYSALNIRGDSGSANGFILYCPNLLCSTRRARRTDDVWVPGCLWRAHDIRAIVLRSGSCALAPTWRVSLRTMPPHLLIVQCLDSRTVHKAASR